MPLPPGSSRSRAASSCSRSASRSDRAASSACVFTNSARPPRARRGGCRCAPLARRGPARLSSRLAARQLLLALGERGLARVVLLVRDRRLRLRDLPLALGQRLLRAPRAPPRGGPARRCGRRAPAARARRPDPRVGLQGAGSASGGRLGPAFAACPARPRAGARASGRTRPAPRAPASAARSPRRPRRAAAGAPRARPRPTRNRLVGRLIAANDRRGGRRSPPPAPIGRSALTPPARAAPRLARASRSAHARRTGAGRVPPGARPRARPSFASMAFSSSTACGSRPPESVCQSSAGGR